MGFSLSPLVRALQGAMGRGANIVNHDIIDPFERDVIQPVQRAPRQLVRAITQPQQQRGFQPAPGNKVDVKRAGFNDIMSSLAQNAAHGLFDTAKHELGFTDQFGENLLSSNAYIAQPTTNSSLTNGAQAAGLYYGGSGRPNEINIAPDAQRPEILMHEGLHRVYDKNPEVQQEFSRAYKQSFTPDLRRYLQARLQNYQGAQGIDVKRLDRLPPALQTEIHSYIPEYYDQSNKVMPPALQKYYSKYYNPQQAHQRTDIRRNIADAIYPPDF